MPGEVDRILRDRRARDLLLNAQERDRQVIARATDRWRPAVELVKGEVTARGAGHFVARIARTGALSTTTGRDGRAVYRRASRNPDA